MIAQTSRFCSLAVGVDNTIITRNRTKLEGFEIDASVTVVKQIFIFIFCILYIIYLKHQSTIDSFFFILIGIFGVGFFAVNITFEITGGMSSSIKKFNQFHNLEMKTPWLSRHAICPLILFYRGSYL